MATKKKSAKRETFKGQREVKRFVDSTGTTLTLAAVEISGGRFRSYVTLRGAKDSGIKTQRAMVENHESWNGAVARVTTLVTEALRAGWLEKRRATKPPAFTELPKPVITTAQQTKKR